jgi:ribonucleoside-diphosphate reductase beta chain
MRHIDAPEVCQALSRHAFDESVHSETYQHCIEALSLGEDEVYSLYKRIPQIAQKFAHARQELSGLYIDRIETRAQLEDFVYSYIFFAMIFEGVWFYNGFSPIFALARTQLMMGTAEELQYIARDEIQHVSLGANIIRTIIQENNIELDYPRIRKMFRDAYDVNMTYIRYALRDEWMGITVGTYEQHERYMSNRRCRMLGVPVAELPFEPTEPSLTWLDEMNGHRKEKNFFESRCNGALAA